MVISDWAEAAVEIRGQGLTLWSKESPVPLTREQARDLAGFLLSPRAPTTTARLVAAGGLSMPRTPPGRTGGFRLATRIGDGAQIQHAITVADAAEIARLVSVAWGEG